MCVCVSEDKATHRSHDLGSTCMDSVFFLCSGSLLDIVRHVTTKGVKGGVLDEVVIATVLKDVVQGLEYFHANGQIHR